MLKLNSLFSAGRVSQLALKSFGSVRFQSTKEIFVGKLPKNLTPQNVREIFEAKATIDAVRMPVNSSGNSRGFAFLTVKEEMVPTILSEFKNLEIEGTHIVIEETITELKKKDAHQTY